MDFASVYRTNINWHKIKELFSIVKESLNGTILKRIVAVNRKQKTIFLLSEIALSYVLSSGLYKSVSWSCLKYLRRNNITIK